MSETALNVKEEASGVRELGGQVTIPGFLPLLHKELPGGKKYSCEGRRASVSRTVLAVATLSQALVSYLFNETASCLGQLIKKPMQ